MFWFWRYFQQGIKVKYALSSWCKASYGWTAKAYIWIVYSSYKLRNTSFYVKSIKSLQRSLGYIFLVSIISLNFLIALILSSFFEQVKIFYKYSFSIYSFWSYIKDFINICNYGWDGNMLRRAPKIVEFYRIYLIF